MFSVPYFNSIGTGDHMMRPVVTKLVIWSTEHDVSRQPYNHAFWAIERVL